MLETIKPTEKTGTVQTAGREVCLSIEAAVGGGSLSILENRIEIAGWSGTQEVSKAEELLEQAARILKENRLAKNQIKLISVSKDVGSSTGQKIGLALAKGLVKSFKCALVETSVLEALLLEVRDGLDGDYISVVVSGKKYLWWQIFKRKNNLFISQTAAPKLSTPSEFYHKLDCLEFERVVFSQSVVAKDLSVKNMLSGARKDKIIISQRSLAQIIGLKAIKVASDNKKVLYVVNPQT